MQDPSTGGKLRVIIAFAMLLPPILFAALQIIARPDLETWLQHKMLGLARRDAFDGVSRIAPLFTVVCGATSLLAAYLILSRRSQFLLPLAVGPLLTGLLYLALYGVTDPAWFTLMALLTIGMLVGSLVTALWFVMNWKLQKLSKDANGNDRQGAWEPQRTNH